MIRYDIDLAVFSIEDARRHLVADDPQAQFALSQFGEAEGLTPPVAGAPDDRQPLSAQRRPGRFEP